MRVRTYEHCLWREVGIETESDCDCLLSQLREVLKISDSQADLKVEKVEDVVGGALNVGTP